MSRFDDVIERLDALAFTWPKGVWLYAADSILYLMRDGADGKHAVTERGGVDPDYIITHFNIPSDGGDW